MFWRNMRIACADVLSAAMDSWRLTHINWKEIILDNWQISEAKQRKVSLTKAVEAAKVGRQDTVRGNSRTCNFQSESSSWVTELFEWLFRVRGAPCWRSYSLWERSALSCRPSWRSTESVTQKWLRRWVSTQRGHVTSLSQMFVQMYELSMNPL